MKIFNRAFRQQPSSAGPVKPTPGCVLPEHKRTTLVPAEVVLALVRQGVFDNVTFATWARPDGLVVEVEFGTVVFTDFYNHLGCLFNHFRHVDVHGFFASLHRKQRRFHLTRQFR